MNAPKSLLQQSTELHQQGHLSDAEVLYRRILEDEPSQAEALHGIGLLAYQTGRVEESVEWLLQAIAANPQASHFHVNLANIYRKEGQEQAAVAHYQQALNLNQNQSEVHGRLGGYFLSQQRWAEALPHFQFLAAHIQPNHPGLHQTLGNLYREMGDPERAFAHYTQAVTLQPDYAMGHFSLGQWHVEHQQWEQAQGCFKKAVALNPKQIEAYLSLGSVLAQQNKPHDALFYYEQARTLEPENTLLLEALAKLYAYLNEGEKAQRIWEKLLTLPAVDPLNIYFQLGSYHFIQTDYQQALQGLFKAYHQGTVAMRSDAANVIGCIYAAIGDIQTALPYLKESVSLNPNDPERLASLLFYLHADPDATETDIFDYFCLYGQRFADPLLPSSRHFTNTPEPERPIRVGYVSADFNAHSAIGAFLWLLEIYDPQQFEVFAYANNSITDDVTQQIRERIGKNWRDIAHKNDEDAALLIVKDGIDILVDLSGHTKGNRLGIFARKPAPIQVTGLGFGGTSGMKAMDYRITDPYLVPFESHRYNTEKILPISSIMHFAVTDERLDEPLSPLPGMLGEKIVFGYGNNPFKLNDRVIRCVAEILKQAPNSQFHMKYPLFDHDLVKAHFYQQFGQYGIEPNRLFFMGATDAKLHRMFYHGVDVVLDPFPYNGGMSTLDALWMQRPVITLARGTRAGVSILNVAGCPEWIATNEASYIETAVYCVSHLNETNQKCEGLRIQMLKSPLCQVDDFVHEIENGYRQIWREWCEKQNDRNG